MASVIGERFGEIVYLKDWTKRKELADNIRHRKYKTKKKFL